MGYIHFGGRKYGVVPCRICGIFESILLNIPLIRELYTKKISVSLTSISPKNEPITGIFGKFRVLKRDRVCSVEFMVPEPFYNILVTVRDAKTNKQVCQSEHIKYRSEFLPGTVYYLTVNLENKN